MDIILGISAVGAPGLFFLGLGLMALPQAPSVSGRASFYASGAWAGIVGVMWLISTQQPLWLRAMIGILLGAFVFVLVPEMVRLTYVHTAASALAPGAVPPHDNTIVSPEGPPPPDLARGHDNTYVGPTGPNGNTIIGGGTIIGSHACGGPGDVVIGSHAGANLCPHPEKPAK